MTASTMSKPCYRIVRKAQGPCQFCPIEKFKSEVREAMNELGLKEGEDWLFRNNDRLVRITALDFDRQALERKVCSSPNLFLEIH